MVLAERRGRHVERAGTPGVTLHVLVQSSKMHEGGYVTIRGSSSDRCDILWWIGFWQMAPYPKFVVM